ncbi:MAG TPA: histidine--tRNA ligase, partial [Synergistales bacterium]|nr:histidine--tRNA ligase [Synergistales bacterium]
MSSISAPRGVRDILPDESWKWEHVLDVTARTAKDFGYREIHLPVFEHTELFSRGVGETTDVVEKEMYTFEDRAGRSLTLRPELSASMVRSYLENRMDKLHQPVKLWSAGPMFRYERPQKGRYRQFWQIDFEAMGSQDPYVDVETIALSLEIFKRLGLSRLEVVVNSVGCPVCRPVHREALQDFLRPRLNDLCETCQTRFDRNPLRILDCKNPACREITDGAPDTISCLCDECSSHFSEVRKGLDTIGAAVSIDKRLVRGLDYYTKTAYEVLSGDLGAQNAVCGGGRYDNLAESIGGPHTPGVGFAAGVERIVLTMEQQGCSFGRQPLLDAFVVCSEEGIRDEAVKLLYELRSAGIAADIDYSGRSFKAQFKFAGSSGAAFACVMGPEEVSSGSVTVKNLESGEQRQVARADVASAI